MALPPSADPVLVRELPSELPAPLVELVLLPRPLLLLPRPMLVFLPEGVLLLLSPVLDRLPYLFFRYRAQLESCVEEDPPSSPPPDAPEDEADVRDVVDVSGSVRP